MVFVGDVDSRCGRRHTSVAHLRMSVVPGGGGRRFASLAAFPNSWEPVLLIPHWETHAPVSIEYDHPAANIKCEKRKTESGVMLALGENSVLNAPLVDCDADREKVKSQRYKLLTLTNVPIVI
ncbi:hypothetical protein CCM_04331 [Cordyceps militaris CM01]|uniref:Uncharacterized protein n=1 Tax=Cordyceps militaris (strain CM01) TaxID=983644 RepID=G3JEE6_CORMM|nr:uncharacterized protein CCM_04331 [Cordyceps militaris CM01]EGX92959.1 hypothetical protein CCM_04331 [Cordyceps militaris CM01]